MRFVSRNVNSPHRISLKTHWQIDGQPEPDDPKRMEIRCLRSFHRPTGLSKSQVVRFCFEPILADICFLMNGVPHTLTTIRGLASVPITDMMESVNRLELRWQSDSLETPQLPEHFAAWLEISDENYLTP